MKKIIFLIVASFLSISAGAEGGKWIQYKHKLVHLNQVRAISFNIEEAYISFGFTDLIFHAEPPITLEEQKKTRAAADKIIDFIDSDDVYLKL